MTCDEPFIITSPGAGAAARATVGVVRKRRNQFQSVPLGNPFWSERSAIKEPMRTAIGAQGPPLASVLKLPAPVPMVVRAWAQASLKPQVDPTRPSRRGPEA